MKLLEILTVLGHISRAPHDTVTGYHVLGAERLDGPHFTYPDVVVVAIQRLEREPPQADKVHDERRALVWKVKDRHVGGMGRTWMKHLHTLPAQFDRSPVGVRLRRRMHVTDGTAGHFPAAQHAVFVGVEQAKVVLKVSRRLGRFDLAVAIGVQFGNVGWEGHLAGLGQRLEHVLVADELRRVGKDLST